MGKIKNELGNRYGRLLVISQAPRDKGRVKWHCRCDCGNELDVIGTALRSGNTKSCGCLQKEYAKSTAKEEVGNRYGFLTVIERAETPEGKKNAFWTCLCDCGNYTTVEGTSLRSGHTKSCGKCSPFISPGKKDETGNRYGHLLVVSEAGTSKEGRTLWNCLCDCGNDKIALGKSLRAGLVLSCGCLHSKGEETIALILKEMGIQYLRQHTFKDCYNPATGYPLYFDFYLPEYNIVIEFQGEQHYLIEPRGRFDEKSLNQLKERDELKRIFCTGKKIKLVEIPYYHLSKIDNNYIKEVVLGENICN